MNEWMGGWMHVERERERRQTRAGDLTSWNGRALHKWANRNSV